MELLRENEEKVIKYLIDESHKNTSLLTKNICEESVIIHLNKLGYIEICDKFHTMSNGNIYDVKLTEQGKHYFEDKKAWEKEIKKSKHIKIFKVIAYVGAYFITTGIAVAALVVSILK